MKKRKYTATDRMELSSFRKEESPKGEVVGNLAPLTEVRGNRDPRCRMAVSIAPGFSQGEASNLPPRPLATPPSRRRGIPCGASYLKTGLVALITAIAALTACTDEQPGSGTPAPSPLVALETRTPDGAPAPISGGITLYVTNPAGDEQSAGYEWQNNGFVLLFEPTSPILLTTGLHPARAQGNITVKYEDTNNSDADESIPVDWQGELDITVSPQGTAIMNPASPIILTPQTARLGITLTGEYGEADMQAEGAPKFVVEMNEAVASQPEGGVNAWTHPRNPFSRAVIAAGQTIASGEPLLTLTGGDGLYEHTVYHVASPDGGITFEAGKQYRLHITLSGLGASATITQTDITGFSDASAGQMTTPGIRSADDLVAFAKAYNAAREDGNKMPAVLQRWADTDGIIRLKSDINMTGVTGFEPIGGTYGFIHTFDGGGHTISGLAVDGADRAGLFSTINAYGKVYALHLRGATITAKTNVGGIAGWNYGTIAGCSVTAEGINGSVAGGIAGTNEGTITGCYAHPAAFSGTYAGGITGFNYATVTGCHHTQPDGALPTNGRDDDTFETLVLAHNTVATVSGPSVSLTPAQVDAMNACIATSAPGTPVQWAWLSATDCRTLPASQPLRPAGIYSDADLREFARAVNAGDKYRLRFFQDGEKIYRLRKDVEMTEENFEPIGNNIMQFDDTFDGGGHRIKGLRVTAEVYAGLFGYMSGTGTVYGVQVVDAIFTATSPNSGYAGGIVAYNYGKVSACSFSGTVQASGGFSPAGGIAGQNNGEISGCYSTATTVSGSSPGGIVGWNSTTATSCHWLLGPGVPTVAKGTGDEAPSCTSFASADAFFEPAGDNLVRKMNEAVPEGVPYRWKEIAGEGGYPGLEKK